MKHRRIRPKGSRVRKPNTEILSVTSLICAAGSLAAQTTDTKPAAAKPVEKTAGTNMKEVVVEANANVYNPNRLQSPKYTEPLRDVPQTITVIPKTVIQDRGAFSLRDVLRNTPGISMQVGEGSSAGPGGDLLSIRGSSAGTDWFMDGVRDYGLYNRDPFNLEAVEITKGPTSATAGRGVSGGAINMVSKMARLGRDNLSSFSIGTDNLYRGTVDVNEQLSEHSALRLNGLYHSADTPGRDEANQERWGIAASLAFGLDTDTRFTLNYQHLTENNLPDWGLPFISNAAVGAVGTPPPVSFDKFYGNPATDYEDVQQDALTAIFEHDFSDHVRLRNVTRYSRTHRDSITTAPRFVGATTTIQRELQQWRLTTEAFVNQTNLNVDFDTGILKHALVTGLELSWERQLTARAALANQSRTDLFNPGAVVAGGVGGMPAMPGDAEAHMDTIAFYLFDTVHITRFLELSLGARYDHVEAEGRAPGGLASVSNSDDLFSWKAALVFKPVEHGSIYFGYGTSMRASLDAVSAAGLGATVLAGGSLPAGTVGSYDPEETRAYELGTKWDLFKERLSLTAALFRTEKNKALVRNAGNAGVVGTGAEQVVDGIEIGLAGNLTKHWQIFAGYAWMDGRVTNSPAGATGPLSNVAESSGNLWTTYSLMDDRLQIGLGVQYMGEVHLGRANTVINSSTPVAPDYLLWDAMASYKFTKNFSLRLNVYNLTDERYIDRSGGSVGQFLPGNGRSVALTASVKF